jgi:2-polyprenyl-3-methyl-5-hydroxy-6-metoxy-1,4-benzoquinol methylase
MLPYIDMKNEDIKLKIDKLTIYYRDIFQKYIDIDLESSNVLDIGCGNGFLSFAFAPLVQSVLGIDPSEPMINAANEANELYKMNNVKFINEKIINIDKKYDIIIISNVLHLISGVGLELMLDKAFKLLKENGVLYIKHPTNKSIFADKSLRSECPEFDKEKYKKWIKNIGITKNKIFKYVDKYRYIIKNDKNLHIFVTI